MDGHHNCRTSAAVLQTGSLCISPLLDWPRLLVLETVCLIVSEPKSGCLIGWILAAAPPHPPAAEHSIFWASIRFAAGLCGRCLGFWVVLFTRLAAGARASNAAACCRSAILGQGSWRIVWRLFQTPRDEAKTKPCGRQELSTTGNVPVRARLALKHYSWLQLFLVPRSLC